VDEPIKGYATAVKKFFSCYKKYQHKEPLKDLGVQSMTIEEFWEDNDTIILYYSMESRLLQNKPIQNYRGP
jgi:hypothetical protein